MIIQIDNESILCNSSEEYEVQIYKIFEMKTAEIWISENGGQEELPCLSILINDEEVVINYFGEDECNFVTVGDEEDSRIISFCEGQYDVAGYQVIDKKTAIKGILDYFDSQSMSDNLQWEEL